MIRDQSGDKPVTPTLTYINLTLVVNGGEEGGV